MIAMNASFQFDPSNAPEVDSLSYEQAFAELEQIISALEANEHPLDLAVALFERGQGLARHCSGLLEAAELKIQQLSGGELSGGELSGGELTDFDLPA
jgi:exodeoxyribonuclease VII small subunit